MLRGVRFEVLGPLRGWQGERELDLGSPQQRAVTAMLLLARGRQVSLAALIDGLWEAGPPAAAAGTVRTYISRLRRVLGQPAGGPAGELIQSVGDGYLLAAGSAALDLAQFEDGCGQARDSLRRGDAAKAVRLLREAAALWQGEPLAGVPGPYASSRRVQLGELRLTATEEKLTAELALGEHAAAVAELAVLTAEHPYRERLAELLMLALYRAGRQAEALGVFGQVRQRLADELGIDPGPSLRDLHQRVLAADQGLLLPPADKPVLVA